MEMLLAAHPGTTPPLKACSLECNKASTELSWCCTRQLFVMPLTWHAHHSGGEGGCDLHRLVLCAPGGIDPAGATRGESGTWSQAQRWWRRVLLLALHLAAAMSSACCSKVICCGACTKHSAVHLLSEKRAAHPPLTHQPHRRGSL